MALAKAKEIVSSNPVAVFRSLTLIPLSFLRYFYIKKDRLVLLFLLLLQLMVYKSNESHSKTFCPYCVTVKQLLTQLGVTFKAIELDTES